MQKLVDIFVEVLPSCSLNHWSLEQSEIVQTTLTRIPSEPRSVNIVG